MIRWFTWLLIGILALTSVPADAGRNRTPDVVEDALAYALTDRSKSIQLLEDALADGPSDRERDTLTVHAGEQRRLAGDDDAAHRWFTDVLGRVQRGSDAQAARLGLILMEARGGVDSRMLRVMDDVSERDALPTQNADRYLVLCREAAHRGASDRVAELTRKALGYAREDPEVFARVSAALERLAARASDTGPPGSADGPPSEISRAEQALQDRELDVARRLVQKVLARAEPDSPERREAVYLQRRIDGARVSPTTLGVLLPLSGKYENVGRQIQEALEFGFSSEAGDARLVFVDSGATAETAVAALEGAVIDQGVIAMVGPLLSDETDAVVEAAEALHVPLVSLSQALEDTEDLAWTLQAMVTVRDQIEALVERVMTAESMTSFAIFAPSSEYGQHASTLFRAAVEARGGEIAVAVSYDEDATDFLPFAIELGRKDPESRSRELYELRREALDAGRDAGKVVLSPVLDFQGLFLPDSAKRIPLVCAALAYEEFPMGDFQPHKDSPRIPLLGLNAWNHDHLVGSGGPYVRGSFFPASFVAPLKVMGNDRAIWEPPEAVTAFIEAFKEETGRTPKPLEAVAVDAGRLVAAATKARPATRAAFLEALLAVQLEHSLTGAVGFDSETRRADRTLQILTIVKEGILPREHMPNKAGDL